MSKKRFTTKEFMTLWVHNSKLRKWDKFVAAMRKGSGNPKYSEEMIQARLEKLSADLRSHKIKPPPYPKKRKPNAIGIAHKLMAEGVWVE